MVDIIAAVPSPVLQTLTPAPLDPKPISASLQRHLTDVLANIQTGQRGQATAAVTTQGVEVSVGTKIGSRTTVGGWAGKEWGGKTWSAGAKVGVVW